MKVSVIIPVYNVEKYLPRCIKSVLDQTYQDLEIILVDDGAKDNSSVMCDEYAKDSKNITVIHKENGGLSSARNAGIEIATGDAIFFVDSDDYLSTKCIENMVCLMEENDADISIIQMKYIPENQNDECAEKEIENVVVMNSEQAIEESLYQKLYTCCAPAKLYKRKVIGEVRFPLGRISEDLATCHLFLNNADKIVYSNYYGYYYRQHETSIMHVFNPKRLDALEWTAEIERFCRINYPSIIKASYCRTFNVAMHLLLDLPSDDLIHDIYYDQIWSEIRRTRIKILLDNKVRKREKIAAILSFCGEKILKSVWNSKIAVKRG